MPLGETIRTVGRLLANEINAAVGYQQSFEQLLANNDVDRAIAMLQNRSKEADQNLKDYDVADHKIIKRPARSIYDKKGNFIRDKQLNTIAIPYQKFINEVALVFLYGRPVLWENASINPDADELKRINELIEERENLDRIGIETPEENAAIRAAARQYANAALSQEKDVLEARKAQIEANIDANDAKFQKLVDTLHDARFDAALRECKRYAGAEGCSAMLFHTYQQDNQPKMLIRVLAKSKKDDIYTLFDQYERLIIFAWGYTTKESDTETKKHYDIYTKDIIYNCTKDSLGRWQVNARPNPIGKIPVIVFLQEVEWDGGENLIDRIETAFSKQADNIDDFGSPALVATGKVTNTLPQQEEESKYYELANGGEIKYLEPADAGADRKEEIQMLESQLMEKTFTPTITLEALRGLSNASGATMRAVMLLANIKAEKRKETHDNYLSRVASLMKAIMSNVLDVAGGSYDDVQLRYKFQEPFGADLSAILADLLKQFGAGAISMQTVVEQSYLIANPDKEMGRINKEKEKAQEQKQQALMQNLMTGESYQ